MRTPLPAFHRLVICAAIALSVMPEAAHAAWFGLPSEMPATPVEDWTPLPGDAFIVDTKLNMGYLLHGDGGYTSFKVATGQRRVVRYIGRTYNATTPVRRWAGLKVETKGDRITFGKEGTFLRLFYKNENTPYGIHSHAYWEKMLSDEERFKSMGCVIVSDDMLDVILKTFEVNGNGLDVVTVYGFEEIVPTYETLKNQLVTLNTHS